MTAPRVEPRLLEPLTAAARADVLAAAVTKRFRRGETLVQEGEPGESLHLVRSGRLAVRVSTSDGATATLTVMSAGESFGELALLGDHVRTATVVALEPSETLVLTRSAFDALRHSHPAVERVLTQALARRVQELSAALLEALYEPVDRRVMARLVDLAHTYAAPPGPATARASTPAPTTPGLRTPGGPTTSGPAPAAPRPVVVPITQDDLAGMAGTTRPTTNQVLQRLADEGVLTLGRGRIELRDVAALRRRLDLG
jgi:CRP/FNR family cyclic AMP-dependent transcriptional regulator